MHYFLDVCRVFEISVMIFKGKFVNKCKLVHLWLFKSLSDRIITRDFFKPNIIEVVNWNTCTNTNGEVKLV